MNRTILIWLCLTCATLQAQTPDGFLGEDGILTKAEVNEGWIALFDGHSLFGWRPQKDANFRVQDGAIVVDSGSQCLLCSTTQFSDYELKLEFRCDPKTNSGIFLRTSPDPKSVETDCFELNIAPPDNPFPTGSFVQLKKYGDFKPDDQWHQYEIKLDGDKATVMLDGEEVLDFEHPGGVGRGFIGLQHNSGRVEFRNIKLRPLTKPIFNGEDLTGWKPYPVSEFSVTSDGSLSMKNGKGMLETEGKYGDFALQIEAISHGASLNSGVFFRCIPGEDMNGYESQIQNGIVDGDPTKPEDAGTGAIFRRVDARRVVSSDFEWLAKTIVAEGPHIAVWVNGYQVTDWVDRRKPDKNPRRGLRTEPGTIILQGHDPTTEFSFRDIRISEIRARR